MFTFILQKNILRLVFLNCNERDFESSIKIPGTFPHFLSSRFLIMTIYSLKYTDIIVNSLINITHNTNSSLYVTVRLSHLFPRFFFFSFYNGVSLYTRILPELQKNFISSCGGASRCLKL